MRALLASDSGKPDGLQATGPNQCWCWHIARPSGPTRGVFYDLEVIIDISSRYVVAWMVAPSENAEPAREFIADAIAAQGIDRDQSPSTPTAAPR